MVSPRTQTRRGGPARPARVRTAAPGASGGPGSRRPSTRSVNHRPRRRGRFHPVTAARRVWHAQPLRARLTLMTTGLLTVALLVSSLAVTSLLHSHLLNQVDEQLQATAKTIGTQGLAQIRAGSSNSMPTTYYVEALYLNGESGQTINPETAETFGVPRVTGLSLENATTADGEAIIRTVDSNLPKRTWRVITMLITSSDNQVVGVIAIGLPLSNMMETVEQVRAIVLLTDVAVILTGALAAAYLVNRSLRSLRQIEGVAGRIASGDLSARVPATEPTTTEVGSLQRALNTMLAQNERAFSVQVVAQERMTRFVSDASHELRTPLAAIRGYGELYRMGGVPAERTREVMGRIESEANRMGRLVDDLLQLARMDEGREMTMAPVDLTTVCAGALTDMMVLAPDRDCSLVSLTDPDADPVPVVVTGDRDRLAQVVTNLLGNVVRHTPAGSSVEIAVGTVTHAPASQNLTPGVQAPEAGARRGSGRAGRTGGARDAGAPGNGTGGVRTPGNGVATGAARAAGTSAATAALMKGYAVVEVRDHGPGVPPAEAAKIFQRFYRADTSRNRETGGSGLGLAIVAAIVERHGGFVRMDQTPGGGATVHLELPLAVG